MMNNDNVTSLGPTFRILTEKNETIRQQALLISEMSRELKLVKQHNEVLGLSKEYASKQISIMLEEERAAGKKEGIRETVDAMNYARTNRLEKVLGSRIDVKA